MKPNREYLKLFEPKLVTAFRAGYGWNDLRADAVAGLTVAIVALPLAMALAIASGTTPDKGISTAIIAGFLISALGGSDRKSTRLNSSHVANSYAVFCLKKKK